MCGTCDKIDERAAALLGIEPGTVRKVMSAYLRAKDEVREEEDAQAAQEAVERETWGPMVELPDELMRLMYDLTMGPVVVIRGTPLGQSGGWNVCTQAIGIRGTDSIEKFIKCGLASVTMSQTGGVTEDGHLVAPMVSRDVE